MLNEDTFSFKKKDEENILTIDEFLKENRKLDKIFHFSNK